MKEPRTDAPRERNADERMSQGASLSDGLAGRMTATPVMKVGCTYRKDGKDCSGEVHMRRFENEYGYDD